jgi:uncharacterized SAM-binding protein YcdF (DUF218 family)
MYDALVVLGAGFRADGAVSPALTRRARYASHLYHAGRAPVLVVTGGTNRRSDPMTEAAAMEHILFEAGVPANAVFPEPYARNTAENARFSAAILRSRSWNHVGIVTDPAHMPRALMAFRYEGIAPIPDPVPDVPTRSGQRVREALAYLVYRARYARQG